MKSYYLIMLFTLFANVMAIIGVIQTACAHQDLSPADGAVVALAILAFMLAYRLAQAEKRIAHLEDKIEGKDELKKKSESGDKKYRSGK